MVSNTCFGTSTAIRGENQWNELGALAKGRFCDAETSNAESMTEKWLKRERKG